MLLAFSYAASVGLVAPALCTSRAQWIVSPELHVRTHTIGTSDRTFPGVSITAKTGRIPFFDITYLMMPWMLLSLLAVLTACARRPEDGNNRAQLSLMLVLTAFTYRIAVSAKLPPISYTSPRTHTHSA